MLKLVILDYDGTLYSGDNFTNWQSYCEERLFELTKNNSKYKTYITQKPNFREPGILIKALNYCNLKPEDWYNAINSTPYQLNAEKLRATNSEFLKKLKSNHKLYVVTNSPPNFLKITNKLIGLDTSYFEEIISNSFEENSKIKYYKYILEKEKINPNEVLMIGDNYLKDIVPALELGLNVFLVDDVKNYNNNFWKYIKKLDNSESLTTQKALSLKSVKIWENEIQSLNDWLIIK